MSLPRGSQPAEPFQVNGVTSPSTSSTPETSLKRSSPAWRACPKGGMLTTRDHQARVLIRMEDCFLARVTLQVSAS